MSELFDVVQAFFTEDEWSFSQLEGRPTLQLVFQGENGRWTCYAQVREAQAQFVFYSILPPTVPPAKRAEVAEFLTRANYGLVIGNFEMNLDDGEVRYKTSLDVEGDRLSPALIRQVVYSNIFVTDRYLPGLMSVIYGSQSPADAIANLAV
jgi:hypothetical protein